MRSKYSKLNASVGGALVALLVSHSADAALALDRTRVIVDGNTNSAAMNVTNQNKDLPYLAQAWVEDEGGHKINAPIMALPPLQRVEAGTKTQVKVQVTGGESALPQDRESLFYFNLREIPPKSDKPNTLQLALQSRIKLFYRPAALIEGAASDKTPWQEQVTLSREGGKYVAHNPTAYYVIFSSAAASEKGEELKGFEPVTIAPKSSKALSLPASAMGSHPVLTYINDYGGRPRLSFSCSATTCKVTGRVDG